MIVGHDGLMDNVAKDLSGQIALGINPDPAHFDGVLCPHAPASSGALLDWCLDGNQHELGRYMVEPRVLAQAPREDGQQLLALNKVFIGPRTYPSARYCLHVNEAQERQSSSGLIVATSTG